MPDWNARSVQVVSKPCIKCMTTKEELNRMVALDLVEVKSVMNSVYFVYGVVQQGCHGHGKVMDFLEF